jgi:hypothetical protein
MRSSHRPLRQQLQHAPLDLEPQRVAVDVGRQFDHDAVGAGAGLGAICSTILGFDLADGGYQDLDEGEAARPVCTSSPSYPPFAQFY